ncbi:hypothetical protein [Rhodococcus sp. NPDC049939]|uniref:hypothetical protein n=1 Tax=Rhodococcus sp. NPDC049939 TaxID=3155511 RepID=UPI0033CFBD2A
MARILTAEDTRASLLVGTNVLGFVPDLTDYVDTIYREPLTHFSLLSVKPRQKHPVHRAGRTCIARFPHRRTQSCTVDDRLRCPGKRSTDLGSRSTSGESQSDFLLILQRNLQEEVVRGMSCIREWGGKFDVPVPEVEVLRAERSRITWMGPGRSYETTV